ncbi:MAG TPA: hypothetical protein VF985_09180 [Mariniflexile sp.]
MKYITVTQQNKTDNPDFFKPNNVGTHKGVSTLPNKYKGVVKVDGGYIYRTDLHTQDGFFDYIEPTYDSSTQRVGSVIFDAPNSIFTKEIIDLTEQELEQKAEQDLHNDLAQQLADKRIADGVDNYRKLQAVIIRKYEAKEFSANTTNNRALAEGIMEYFSDNVSMITIGDWTVAKKKLLTAPSSQNASIVSLYNQVKTKVDEYVLNNY